MWELTFRCLSFLLALVGITRADPEDVFVSTTFEQNMGYCYHPGAKLYTGDFNGDGRADLLCHDTNTGAKWIVFAAKFAIGFDKAVWFKDMGWCFGENVKLLIGDFNGDKRSDLLCHAIGSGHKWISFADSNGHFEGTSWEAPLGWCIAPDETLLINDYNGDGSDDMLCHGVAGHVWMAFSDKGSSAVFTGTSWEDAMGYCYNGAYQMRTGDFNGDGRADMICYDTTTGSSFIAYSGSNGVGFSRTWFSGSTKLLNGGAELHIGKFNGDIRSDLLLHSKVDGYKLIAFSNEQGGFGAEIWEKSLGWCVGATGQLYVDDFNGDGVDDLLCHELSSGYKWLMLRETVARNIFTKSDKENAVGICNAANQKLYIGDFNGDGRDDMLCHNKADGTKSINYANQFQHEFDSIWSGHTGWCTGEGVELHIADLNGDKRSDLLCHAAETGYKWIASADASGHFSGTQWHADMGWCFGLGGLYVEDFNGDGTADLFCHDVNGGHKWISFNRRQSPVFVGTSWEASMGWCVGPTAKLYVADFNGDMWEDMLCHDIHTGLIWVVHSRAGALGFGETWFNNLAWCFGEGTKMHIGDFNGDTRSDLLCHMAGIGYTWIAFADINGHFTGTSWEADMHWCVGSSQQLYVGDFNGDWADDLLCHDTMTGNKWLSLSQEGTTNPCA